MNQTLPSVDRDVNVCTVSNLTVAYRSGGRYLRAVKELTFDIHKGETLAVVGETGSGKSSAAAAMIRMLPSNGVIVEGAVTIAGRNIFRLSERQIRGLRGSEIGYVPQQPMSAFNPTMTVGRQIAEPLIIHKGLRYRQAYPVAGDMLGEMGIHEVDRVLRAYPHELSGGMLQRAMMAAAMICGPSLLIADEPTSALDVTVQRQILRIIKDVQERFHLAVLVISHDLELVSRIADRILVMYAGRAVELSPTTDLLSVSRHPYARGLIQSMPNVNWPHKSPLPSLQGYPLSALQVDEEIGCPFHYRCSRALPECREAFPSTSVDGDHEWACYNPEPVP
jgi:oligopeptide/dipeptide ABC transporter ATP-binding protein